MNTLTFNNKPLQIVERNNQIWISASDLASALNYKRSDKVTQIYNRNKDEFTDSMTETLKLRFSGNLSKTVRFFSLRGAHLIAMFANTDIAKMFRKWVLDILDRESGIRPEKQQVIKTRDYKALNIDNMQRQQKYLTTIQEYHYRIFDIYCETLADFLKKASPHIHYNITTALDKIHINIGLSLNHIRSELPRRLISQ